MIAIVVNITRTLDVLHQVKPVGTKCPVNAFQNIQRLCLIVNRVKRGNKIIGLAFGLLVKSTEVRNNELYIAQFFIGGFLPRAQHRFTGEINTCEATLWKQLSQTDHDATAATTDVEHLNSAFQFVGQSRYQWQNMRFER